MQQGDKVRIGTKGVSIFEVVEPDLEGRVVIQAAVEGPGRYPFSMRPDELVPADE